MFLEDGLSKKRIGFSFEKINVQVKKIDIPAK